MYLLYKDLSWASCEFLIFSNPKFLRSCLSKKKKKMTPNTKCCMMSELLLKKEVRAKRFNWKMFN